MTERFSVNLGLWLEPGSSIMLRHVEWWRPESRLAVVMYEERGYQQEFGLRLDLDKQVFLDEVGDPALDAAIQQQAQRICASVALYRNTSRVPMAGYRAAASA